MYRNMRLNSSFKRLLHRRSLVLLADYQILERVLHPLLVVVHPQFSILPHWLYHLVLQIK